MISTREIEIDRDIKRVMRLQTRRHGEYWDGWEDYSENIEWYLMTYYSKDHVVRLKKIGIKNYMKQLKEAGIVASFPIWGDDGKLNGKGWFRV